MAGKVMLDGKDLAAIAQRALGQEANFREAVEDHPRRLDTLNRIENLARGLTQLQVGRIQKALLLFGVEQGSPAGSVRRR